MKYLVIEYRNIGTVGKPEMTENVIFLEQIKNAYLTQKISVYQIRMWE